MEILESFRDLATEIVPSEVDSFQPPTRGKVIRNGAGELIRSQGERAQITHHRTVDIDTTTQRIVPQIKQTNGGGIRQRIWYLAREIIGMGRERLQIFKAMKYIRNNSPQSIQRYIKINKARKITNSTVQHPRQAVIF